MKIFNPFALLITVIIALITLLWYYVNFTEHRMESVLITNFSKYSFEPESIQISLKGEENFRKLKNKLEDKDAKTISKMYFGLSREIDKFKINIFGTETILSTFKDTIIHSESNKRDSVMIRFYKDSTYRDIYRINISDGSPTPYFRTFVFMNRSYSMLSIAGIYTDKKRIANLYPWPDNREIMLFPNKDSLKFDHFEYFLSSVSKEDENQIYDIEDRIPRDPSAGIGVELGNSNILLYLKWILEIFNPIVSLLFKLLVYISSISFL